MCNYYLKNSMILFLNRKNKIKVLFLNLIKLIIMNRFQKFNKILTTLAVNPKIQINISKLNKIITFKTMIRLDLLR
jgi:hypothetical protein